MKLQYEILKSFFDINPNIVIAYIDQTDIGDEICRYKTKDILIFNWSAQRKIFKKYL